MNARNRLSPHLARMNVRSLRKLLAASQSNDPQEELDEETVEAIRDQIEWLEYLEEERDLERPIVLPSWGDEHD